MHPQQLPKDFVKQVTKELCEQKFSEFVKRAWHILEPGTPLIWGWHIEAICDHLQAVSEGKITRLIISISPGSMKSLLAAVFWPAWEWTRAAHMRYVVASHSLAFASRDSLRCRDLVTSKWYREFWPIRMKEDANQTLKFINSSTGYRWALPYSKLTGGRGNRLVIDDPISVMDALASEVEREKVNRTFLTSATSRLNNPKTDAIVIIAQRIHMDDLIGRLLDLKMKYVHLNIPMEYRGDESKTVIGWSDPRKEIGELMLPEQRDKAELDELKQADVFAYSAQCQQDPVPEDDGFFKAEWFRRFDPANVGGEEKNGIYPLPRNLNYYMTSDHAPAGKNDYNTIRVWGMDQHKNLYLVDSFHKRSDIRTAMGIDSDESGRVTIGQQGALRFVRKYLDSKTPIQCWYAEPDNNFKSVESIIRDAMQHTNTMCRIEYASMHNKSKKEKALAYQTLSASGKIFIPNTTEGSETILEYTQFPFGKHDDRVDADSILPRELQNIHAAVAPKEDIARPKDGYKKMHVPVHNNQRHLFL